MWKLRGEGKNVAIRRGKIVTVDYEVRKNRAPEHTWKAFSQEPEPKKIPVQDTMQQIPVQAVEKDDASSEDTAPKPAQVKAQGKDSASIQQGSTDTTNSSKVFSELKALAIAADDQ